VIIICQKKKLLGDASLPSFINFRDGSLPSFSNSINNYIVFIYLLYIFFKPIKELFQKNPVIKVNNVYLLPILFWIQLRNYFKKTVCKISIFFVYRF
jgi:hypothetical protein